MGQTMTCDCFENVNFDLSFHDNHLEKILEPLKSGCKFKKNAYLHTIKQRIRANPTSNTLKWSRYLLHHRYLIPSKKYKIIKKPNTFIRNSVFLRFDGNNAVFEDITVPISQYFFIEMKQRTLKTRSLKSRSRSKSKSGSRSKHSI